MNRSGLRLAVRPLSFMDTHADLPDAVLEPRPGRLLAWDTETVGTLFRTDRSLAHPGSRQMRPLLGPRSLIWAEGERHTAYRRVLGAPLQGRRLAHRHDTIATIVHRAIDTLTPGTVFTLLGWTRRVALKVIAQILLGNADSEVLGTFSAWIDRALGSRPRTLFYRHVRGGLPLSGEDLDRRLVSAAKSAAGTPGGGESLAAHLLAPGSPLGAIDDEDLRDQIVSMLFAGHETTAAATAWTLYWLDRHDPVRRAVVSELDGSGADGADPARVPLLQAVISESLRITPPVAAAGPRTARSVPLVVPGRACPPGTVVIPAIYLSHRRAEHFPEPHRFLPGRFLSSDRNPEGYLPFGGGTRYCLGAQIAPLEVRMTVAALLRRRELRCVNPDTGAPRMRGQVIVPSARLRMRVTSSRE
jgi:cytochrome P450 family 110